MNAELNEREIRTISEALRVQAIYGIYEPEFRDAETKLKWALAGVRRRMLVEHNLQPNLAPRTSKGLLEEKCALEAEENLMAIA